MDEPVRIETGRKPVRWRELAVIGVAAVGVGLVLPGGWALAVVVLAMAVLGGWWREHARWVEVGSTGVRYAGLFGAGLRAWDDVVSIERSGRGVIAIKARAWWMWRLELKVDAFGPRLFDALRERAPLGRYSLRADEELELRAGVRAHRRELVRARVTMERQPRATYRDAERGEVAWSLRRPFPPERRAFRRALVVSTSFGLSTMIVAALVTFEQGVAALLLLVVGFLLASLLLRHLLGVALGLRALRRKLVARLGPEVRLDPRGMLVSHDGRARARQLPSDLDDRALGLHLHVEALDAEGHTEASTIVLGLDLGLPASARPMTLVEVADVREGAVCALDDERWPDEPRVLRTDHHAVVSLRLAHGPDGALLTRIGRGGRPVGDTFHEDAAAARAQAASELEHSEWREEAR